jgi:hypothetical protein
VKIPISDSSAARAHVAPRKIYRDYHELFTFGNQVKDPFLPPEEAPYLTNPHWEVRRRRLFRPSQFVVVKFFDDEIRSHLSRSPLPNVNATITGVGDR